jgi:hypothetical protein
MLPATEYADIKARDDERKLVTNVGLGLAIAGGAVGVAAITLWLLPESGSRRSPKTEKRASITAVPVIGPGSLGLAGTF